MKGKLAASGAVPVHHGSATHSSQTASPLLGQVWGDSAIEDGAVHRLATGFKLLLQNPKDPSGRNLPPGISGTQVRVRDRA